jgi:thiamine kinase-like enzyme
MMDNHIITKKSTESNKNIILKTDENLNIKTINCEEIIKNFLKNISLDFNKNIRGIHDKENENDLRIVIKKTNEGLSNDIFFINVENEIKLFLKIFNNIIDRRFEEVIIKLNSQKGNCPKILDTDFENYRIEEFLENIQKLKREEILTNNFFEEILTPKIINFNLLLFKEKESYIKEKNVFSILNNAFCKAQKAFINFKLKFENWKINNIISFKKNESETKKYCNNTDGHLIHDIDLTNKDNFQAFSIDNYNLIESFLYDGKLFEILNEIFPKEFITEFSKDEINQNDNRSFENLIKIPLFFSHNDVHLYNFIYKEKVNIGMKDKIKDNLKEKTINLDNIMLIDYEYSCFNVIGFDIVNFFIECFFNLEYPEYPFYEKFEKDTKTIYEKFYYEKYLKYFFAFLTELKSNSSIECIFGLISEEKFIEIFSSYDYYCKICKLASIYWFYTAVQFLDFETNIKKTGFNYIDYSADRLGIYRNFFN